MGVLPGSGSITMKTLTARQKWLTPHNYLSLQLWESLGTGLLNLFIIGLLFVYLFPMVYMVATSLMEGPQLSDANAPAYPAQHIRVDYKGKTYAVYNVPFENGEVRQLALIKPGRTSSEFIDPAHPDQAVVTWQGNWRKLIGVYK